MSSEPTTFELKGQPYIELNKLLKLLSLVESGAFAKQCIKDGEVMVNEAIELQIRKKLRSGDVVDFAEHTIRIS